MVARYTGQRAVLDPSGDPTGDDDHPVDDPVDDGRPRAVRGPLGTGRASRTPTTAPPATMATEIRNASVSPGQRSSE